MTKTFGNFTDLMDFSRSTSGTALRKVSYGSELVTNGTFDTDTTGWAATGGSNPTLSFSSGQAVITATQTGSATFEQTSTEFKQGKLYQIKINVVATTDNIDVWNKGTSSVSIKAVKQGENVINYVATQDGYLRFGALGASFSSGEGFTFDNISVKEVTLDSGTDDPVVFNHPADTPRIEYAADGTVKGLLIEEARTNLITRSETLDAAPWSNAWGGGTTRTANAATAPDGTTTADKLQQIDGGGDGVNVSLSGFSVDSYYTVSCFIKNVDSTKSQLNLFNNSSNEAVNVLWNGSSVSSITTTGANVSNANYKDVGNGWIRVYATVQVKNASVNFVLIPENTSSSSGNGAYFWGAQVEAGSFATSYIPTSGASATRSADIASIAVENFGYNQDEGTVVVDVQSDNFYTDAAYYRVLGFGNTVNSGLYAAAGPSTFNQFRFRLNDSSGNAVFGPITLGAVAATASAGAKLAITFAPNDFAISANGSVIETDTSGVFDSKGVTRIEIGNQSNSSNFLNGHIRDFQYYPRRLTNRQLQELTGATNTYDYTTVEAGTITRTPVATGADLVAYSGFSATNYLEQPYNPDLDFGTGDFCVMGWLNRGTDSYGTIVYRSDSTSSGTGRFYLTVYPHTTAEFDLKVGTAAVLASAKSIPASTWVHFAAVRRSGVLYLYMNAEQDANTLANSTDIDGSTNKPTTTIGVRNTDFQQGLEGSLALLRISATAPTAEQIAKIYEDEKVLFQEGAQATLYGSSDAVTALAHDDTTNLLHVGTSAGRSVFQGLRRVENTTDAVGTAISAFNGLVVEE